ncbi:MAG: HAMP domain-containing histidine kinase [Lachnospiraceae bacterium]|nr:HAMP domain-containing histidine kinase [Lachnospiraceae bacterium]
MKSFNRIFAAVIIIIISVFFVTNSILLSENSNTAGRPYRVEIQRLIQQIEAGGLENIDFSDCSYVVNIKKYDADFYNSDYDYLVKEINGELYRFDYTVKNNKDRKMIATINIILAAMSAVIILVFIFIKYKILLPFYHLRDIPYELSKGNLTIPIKESKYHFFGKFVWGINVLRENIELQKQRELELLREKKTLVLSLSHDIKTPLSAIKLYSKALSKGLYDNREKQIEIAESINDKADEIESFVSEIIKSQNEEILKLDVNIGEFYLSDLERRISIYYKEKLDFLKIDFCIEKYSDCIIKGDLDRSTEVLQNIIENAIKYGNGQFINVAFSEEENCRLITVKNSGCTLSDNELPHIFDSFWRGANSENIPGSGLGLYICRQLMHKMNGEIFAEISGNTMLVTTVFVMAG